MRKRCKRSAMTEQERMAKNLAGNPVAKEMFSLQVKKSMNDLKTAAELHAFGDSAAGLSVHAGQFLYAISHAVSHTPTLKDSPEVRIMRGMANATEQLANNLAPMHSLRDPIYSGLLAIERLLPRLKIIDIFIGMVACDNKILNGGFGAADIHRMLGAPVEAV